MKTANILTKIKRILLAVAFCLVAMVAVILPSSMISAKSAEAAGGLTFTAHTSVSTIKTSKPDTEFIVYGVVSGNTIDLFSAEFRINVVDTDVLELKEYMTPAQIATELGDSSLATGLFPSEVVPKRNLAGGKATVYIDNNWNELTAETFVIGGYKVAVKAGATLTAGGSASITIDQIVIPDYDANPLTPTEVGTNISISFAEASAECEITGLSSTQEGVKIEKDGDNYKAEVAYAVDKLDTGKLNATVSADATVAYTPNGSVALTEGAATEVTVKVTAENGANSKEVKLSVTRKAGEEANTLSALAVKNGSTELLTKGESDLATGGTFAIDGEVAFADKDNLSVETTKNGANSLVTISVDGANGYTGKAEETDKTLALTGLAAGAHTVVITVKPEKGAETQYTVTFTVAAEGGGTVNPGPNPGGPGTNPGGPVREPGVGIPDADGGFYKPAITDIPTLTFSGEEQDISTALSGCNWYNPEYMELTGTTKALKAGTYTATIKLTKGDGKVDPFWKDKSTSALSVKLLRTVVLLDETVPLAANDSLDLNWEMSPYLIPVSSWGIKAGELPKLNGITPSLLNCLDLSYAAEDGAPVDPANLEVGSKYSVTASVKSGYEDSLKFTDGTATQPTAIYNFTYEAAPVGFFMQEMIPGIKNWLLLVIAAAVILLLVLIIVIAVKAAKKHKENAAYKREEKLARQQQKREEAQAAKAAKTAQVAQPANPAQAGTPVVNNIVTGDGAKQAQPQPAPQPQFIPIPQSAPQPQIVPIPQTASNNSAEIASLMAEISALKAGQNASQETAALRAQTNSSQEAAALRAELNALRAGQETSQEAAALRAELNALRAGQGTSQETAALRNELNALRAGQNTSQETAALRAEISALRAGQGMSQETAALRNELNALRAGQNTSQESAALRAEISALRAGQGMSQETAALRNELNALRAGQNTSQESAALRAEISALRAGQASSQESAALRAEISALKAGQAATQETAALRAEISALRNEHASNQEAAALRAEISALRAEQASAKEISALRAETTSAQEIAALKAERNSAQDVAALRSEIAALRAERSFPQVAEAYRPTQEVAELKAAISAMRAEQASAKEIAAIRAETSSTQELAALKAEMSALRTEQAYAKEIAELKAELHAKEIANLRNRNDMPYAMRAPEPMNVQMPVAAPASAPAPSALSSEIAALRTELNAKEIAALHNDITYAKRGSNEAMSVPVQTALPAPVAAQPQAGISPIELTEIVAAAVSGAMASASMAQRETRLTKANEANRARVVKSETAQPVSAVYPPNAVTTTVTTTRVDTTKKMNEDSDVSGSESNAEGVNFDVYGFYDPANERDVRMANRDGAKRNGK